MSTSSKRLFLVRHAKTAIDPNVPVDQWLLDPKGKADLERLAALPLLGSADRIVASTEPKSLLTAGAIRAAQGLPAVESFADLGEIHKSNFVLNHDEVMAQLFAEPAVSVLPGWESGAAALARFSSRLDSLVDETQGDLIVVTHATVISLYLAQLLGQARVDPTNWAAIGFPDLAIINPRGRRVLQPFGAWRA
ncbi:MAG TPA: histidine phosphatase family protein [Symbiobacteriaceae bacterium]|nr:histidine phosphatase family protein [Symbiobacteriaceae bacterium]